MSPEARVSLTRRTDRIKPTIKRTVVCSFFLSIFAGFSLLVVGYYLGRWIFGFNPAYWFEAIYVWDINESPESFEKVRIQTGIRFGSILGATGFCCGLFLPWIRFGYLRNLRELKKTGRGDSHA
jgi:hypothetical protein